MSEEKQDYGSTNIVRIRKDARYFVASNIPFNDTRLSWEARGMMGYLLSKPNGWKVRQEDLINQSSAGPKAVRRILAELRQFGYMDRKRVKREHGFFEWETTIYESPELNKSSIYPLGIDGAGIYPQSAHILSTDLDLKKKIEETEKKEKTAEVFKFYENNIELLTQYNSMKLGDMIDIYSSAWVIEALKDCVEYGARNLKYAEKILSGWRANGFRSDTRSKNKAVNRGPDTQQRAQRLPSGI